MKKTDRLPSVIVSPVFVNGTTLLRAFGRRGAHCVAVSSRRDVSGFASRFAREKVFLPGLGRLPGLLADWLLSRRDLYGALVIPTGDEILAQINANRDRLENKYRLCIPQEAVCRVALDKAKLADVAADAGIPSPRTVPVPTSGPADKAGTLGFPVLVKPRYCIDFQRAFRSKLVLAQSPADLEGILAKCRRLSIGVVLQEPLPRKGALASYSAYVRRSGEIAGDFTSLRVGIHPPGFGTGFLEVSKRIGPILEYGRALVKALSYQGALINLDFKQSPRDGLWNLLDLNARSWRQVSLAPLSGLDVFEHLLRDYTDQPPPPDGNIRYGSWWFYIKDALLAHRANPDDAPSFGQYLSLLWSPRTFGLLDTGDLRPILGDIKPLILRRIKKYIPYHPAQ